MNMYNIIITYNTTIYSLNSKEKEVLYIRKYEFKLFFLTIYRD